MFVVGGDTVGTGMAVVETEIVTAEKETDTVEIEIVTVGRETVTAETEIDTVGIETGIVTEVEEGQFHRII